MKTLTTKRVIISNLVCAFLALSANAEDSYNVKIIDHSESKPIAKNDKPSAGMKENRRVDVSVDVLEEIKTSVPHVVKTTTKAHLEDGGIIWATSDPLVVKPHLDIKTLSNVKVVKTKIIEPIIFLTYNNYSDYIKRYELLITNNASKGSLKPIKVIKGKGLPAEIAWDVDHDDKIKFDVDTKLQYVLRVYDDKGNFDETNPRVITINNKKASKKEDIYAQIFGKSNLKSRSISVSGARVRVYGQGISTGSILNIDKKEIRVDSEGKFVYENIKHSGTQTLPVTIMDEKGDLYKKDLTLEVKDNHLFLVGIADFTAGQYNVSGNIKPLEADEHYNEDIFIDGRVAFYAKGKIKGKYLMTAQMDTKEDDIKNIFKNIGKKDPKSIFRHLDPDKYYYVYGDDSTSYRDTDSQGKFYLSLEWDKSKALWGNFNTGLTGNEFANVNRSLYGAKLKYSSMNTTKYSDNKTDIIVFASEAGSAYGHNEFEGTGGSLYYLKNTDILQGSEKVWVEIRERNSQRVAQKIELLRGKDYEIDEIQGRIILTRPLTPFSNGTGPSIIKDNPLDGNRVLLKVDYEYIPDGFNSDGGTYGARAKQWLGNAFAVGATYANEGRAQDDYEVKGADITLRGGKDTFIKAEYAESKALQSNGANFSSNDGGLSFQNIENNSTDNSGAAYGVEAMLSLADFERLEADGTLELWYKNTEAGFSSARLGSSDDIMDYGFEAKSQLNSKLCLSSRGTTQEKDSNKNSTFSLMADYKFEKLKLGTEIRTLKTENGSATDDSGVLAGISATYNFNSYFSLYIAGQSTLEAKGNYQDNDLVTLGAKVNYGKFDLSTEASVGDRGNGVQVGADYAYSDTMSMYGTYTLSTDRTDGKRNIFTVGQKSKITNALNVFTEHQFSHSDHNAGVGQAFGMNYMFNKYLTANLIYNRINLNNGQDRDSASVSLNYMNKKVKASTKLEYRVDKDSVNKTSQYLTSNKLSYKLNPSWRVLSKLNYSKSINDTTNVNDAKFIETGLGFAYRPVNNTRLNIIGKYTYLYDLLSSGQESARTDEKSHITTAELSYQLTSKWTIGSKLGYKKFKIREQRDSGQWYGSELKLAALRLNYHLIKDWDAMLEGHYLAQKDDGDKKGMLFGIYKHIGENMKLGVGYNFSDFSDDLTRTQDYNARGWFINVVGKY